MGRWRKLTELLNLKGIELPEVAACYVIYIEGELAYIGSTQNLRARFRKHGINFARYSNNIETPWGRCQRISAKIKVSRKYGDWAMDELRLIRRLQPRLNRVGIKKKSIAPSLEVVA